MTSSQSSAHDAYQFWTEAGHDDLPGALYERAGFSVRNPYINAARLCAAVQRARPASRRAVLNWPTLRPDRWDNLKGLQTIREVWIHGEAFAAASRLCMVRIMAGG